MQSYPDPAVGTAIAQFFGYAIAVLLFLNLCLILSTNRKKGDK